MVKKILFIEGSRDKTNGDLAEGFNILLRKKLENKMPRIVMGNGKSEAIDKFLNLQLALKKFQGEKKFLLVDLDREEEHKEKDIEENKLKEHKNVCFFMIQEMEAWFISQADKVLDVYYKVELSKKLVKSNAKKYAHPDEEIDNVLKKHKKEYRKVQDGVELLKLLDLEKLETDFVDVKMLIAELNK